MSDAPDRPPIALPEDTHLRDEYCVGPVLGAGSFGITYQAEDEHLDTTVAIKEYYPRQIAGRTDATLEVRPHTGREADEFEDGLQQFMEEGRTVARFDHPSVVDVNSYFEENRTGYLVMDYYEGEPLAGRLAEAGGRLPEEEAVGYIHDVLDGLGPVHDAGVLHRDIDPQNIYLRADEGSQTGRRAILIDFGAAREAIGQKSQSLDVILKPGYAPPEQYRPSGNHGPWTDIYACAATLYRCLTGMKPPEAPERAEEDELIPPKELREELSFETDLAIRKGLALAPERRPQTARAFAELLGRTRTAEGQTQAPTQMGTAAPTSSPPAAENDKANRPPQSKTARDSSGARTESEGKPQELSSFDETAFASAQPEESGASFWNFAALGGGIASLVGGTLVFSDAGPVQILSFFGTWIAVCAGLIGLFRQGERLMRPEGRAAISDWLLGEDFAERPSNWPKTFTGLFDAVFTENHLSWTCFWRSAVASAATVTILIAGMTGLGIGIMDSIEVSSVPSLILPLLGVAGLNAFIDYLSLYETRWVLGKMQKFRSPFVRIGFLAFDLMLSAVVYIGILTVLNFGGKLASGSLPATALIHPTTWIDQFAYMLQFIYDRFVLIQSPGTASLISTLFTSVWVWLYVAAGLLLKASRPVLKSLDWLKRFLDVESRPAETMGLLLVVVTSVGFAVSAPFML